MADDLLTRLHITVDSPSLAKHPATAAGRYQLGDEIAHGGMGVIYRATDTMLNREVAVKVLQEKFGPESSAACRFLDEALITGQLQHPGIPAVHDLGTLADGRPFLAMKLIVGQTLDDIITNREPLQVERIGVFEAICQAVAYAHSRGIIHRDLKPANVMVGAFGEVQVMDWGLAKVLTREASSANASSDEAGSHELRLQTRLGPHDADPDCTTDHSVAEEPTDERTQSGQALGTPAYMAPEQARGEIDRIDRRTDVFALGGVLCAMLTGTRPYTGRTTAEVMKKAMNADLADAFDRLAACGADAELIAMCRRCLSADPGARPADASVVAALVAGYRTEVEQRLRVAEQERAAAEAKAIEQRKKRRVQLALAAAVLVIAAGGGAFAWYSERQASAKRADMQRNAEALASWVERCEAALQDDNADAADSALQEIDRRRPDGGGDALADRIALCHTDLNLLRQLDDIDQCRWSMLSEVEGVAAQRKRNAALWRAAFTAAGIAPGTLAPEHVAHRINTSPLRERLLTTLDVWLLSGDHDVREMLRATDPDPFRDEVRDAVQVGDEQRVTALVERPETLSQPPAFTTALGHYKFLPAPLRRAVLTAALSVRPNRLAVLMQLENTYYYDDRIASAPHRLRWLQAAVTVNPRVAMAHYNLGVALSDLGDFPGAISAYRTAIRLAPKFADAYHALGGALLTTGDPDGAIAAYRQAIALDPKSTTAHVGLGNALLVKNDVDGAIAAYREAIRFEPSSARAYSNLGHALLKKGDLTAAIAAGREAVRLKPSDSQANTYLGASLVMHRDFKEAISVLRDAIRLNPTDASAHHLLGIALDAQGDAKGAIAAYREAIRLDPTDAATHYNLGLALKRRGDLAGAIAAYREAIRLDPTDASYFQSLGNVLDAQGDAKGAIAAYREALQLDPTDAETHSNLGAILFENGDTPAAIASFQEALRLDPNISAAHSNLGSALVATGDLDEAVACFEKAVQLEPNNPQYTTNLVEARKLKAQRDAMRPVAPLPREVKRSPPE